MSKVRINDLARELEVKSRAILDVLDIVGVTEKKTHSSSLELDEAERVRAHFQRGKSGAAGNQRVEAASPKPKIDWSRVSKPGDVLKAIQQKKEEAAAQPPRPAPSAPLAAPPAATPTAVARPATPVAAAPAAASQAPIAERPAQVATAPQAATPPAPRRIVPQPRQAAPIVVPPPQAPAIAAKPPAGPVVAKPPIVAAGAAG